MKIGENRNCRKYSPKFYNEALDNFNLPTPDIEKIISEKICKELEKSFSSSMTISNSMGDEITRDDIMEHLVNVSNRLRELESKYEYNFNGEIMSIENVTNLIKFIKASRPSFEFQIALKATGELKGVKKIMNVDIIDIGDYCENGKIYLLPIIKDTPKYFSIKFE